MGSRKADRSAPLCSARPLAAGVVRRVLSEGAFLRESLDAALARTELAVRDRALATELAYGVVRCEAGLRAQLEAHAPRGLPKRDPLLLAHLLVATYQLLALDRVPAFAATSQAVASIKRLRGPRVAAFANALLRRVAADAPRWDRQAAICQTVPRWLWAELSASVGQSAADDLLGVSAAAQPGLCIRLTEAGQRAQPGWLSRARPGRLSPNAHWMERGGDLRRLQGFDQGWFAVQEEGAQWCARALGVTPGQRVLDACAGHGGKAALLAEALQGQGELYVVDRAASKLRALEQEFRRLGLPLPHAEALDFGAPGVAKTLGGGFDRILVDAPCTGTGTLRRRPEIARRLTPADPTRMADLSRRLLLQAARLLAPDGRLLFVICSVLKEEAEAVLESVADSLELVALPALAALDAQSATPGCGRLLPATCGTDGYFVANLRVR